MYLSGCYMHAKMNRYFMYVIFAALVGDVNTRGAI